MNQITKDSIVIHTGELPPETFEWDNVAIDSEFFGQDKTKLHRPHGQFASLAACADGKNVYMVFEERKIDEFIRRLDKSMWYYHNAKYDLTQLRRFADIPDRKMIWDTQLIEQIRYSGYYDRFSLSDVYRRYTGKYLPKEERGSFTEAVDGMNDEMIFYAACDVVADWEVGQAQQREISENDTWLWEQIERPFLFTLLDTGGVLIDAEQWSAIAKEKREKSVSIWDEIQAEHGINIRSNDQLAKFLLENGIKLEKKTDGGKFSVDAKVLKKFKGQHPVIDMVLEYKPMQKGASTYGDSWLEGALEADGRIYTSWNQLGAKTSRMSSDHPNLQNIPVRTDKKYRYCFIAGDGKMFVIGDWSSQEPRNLAYLSQDEKLIEIFRSKKDPYIAVGYEVFDEHFVKKDRRRKEMKRLVLGLSYFMSKYGLRDALDEDIPEVVHTVEYADELMTKFFKKFPGVKAYINDNQAHAHKHGYVETIWGRKIYISPFDPRLDTEAPNYSIQGSAGESMKVAANRLRKRWMKEFGENPIRLYVHDEMAIEVDEDKAEYAKSMMEEIMVDTAESMHEGIPGEAEIFVGKSWGDKE